MNEKTLKRLAFEIRSYMITNGYTFQGENPFPVTFRTITSILATAERGAEQYYSRRTQQKLLDFFDLNYEIKGSEYIINDN